MKKSIGKIICKMVMLAVIVSCCSGCATIAAGILTRGNPGAMRAAARIDQAVIISSAIVAPVVAARVMENRQQAAQEQVIVEEVEPVLVYGEPCYLPAPIVVSYPYDYYTYENVGGYIRLVFWRGGKRFHHEDWREGGRRMRVDHFHAWARSHMVKREMMEHHRAQLEQRHGIRHDDAHFGLNRHADHNQKAVRSSGPGAKQQARLPNKQSQQRPVAKQASQPKQQKQQVAKQARQPKQQKQQAAKQASQPKKQQQVAKQASQHDKQ